jgi:hypothetical protein
MLNINVYDLLRSSGRGFSIVLNVRDIRNEHAFKGLEDRERQKFNALLKHEDTFSCPQKLKTEIWYPLNKYW